jgi:cation diffusion facilitator family transporter
MKVTPYGHGKIEYFSAGFEGALIILAAVGILYKAAPQLLHPLPLPRLELGLLLVLLAALVNLALGVGLIRVGRLTHSLALVADGRHLLSDVYTSAGVLLGLALVRVTGWYWLDGAVACLVALNILWIGGRLLRQSFAGLMDTSDPELLDEISHLLARTPQKHLDRHPPPPGPAGRQPSARRFSSHPAPRFLPGRGAPGSKGAGAGLP